MVMQRQVPLQWYSSYAMFGSTVGTCSASALGFAHSWLHLDVGHYVHQPYVSGSSSFTVELPQTEFEAG